MKVVCWESLAYLTMFSYIFSESESGFDIRKSHDQPIKNKVYRYDWDGETLTNPILIKELPGNLNGKHRHQGGAMTTNLNDEIYFVIGDLTQYGIFQNIISTDNIMETSSIFKVDTQITTLNCLRWE